jgi:hypothetical protein
MYIIALHYWHLAFDLSLSVLLLYKYNTCVRMAISDVQVRRAAVGSFLRRRCRPQATRPMAITYHVERTSWGMMGGLTSSLRAPTTYNNTYPN